MISALKNNNIKIKKIESQRIAKFNITKKDVLRFLPKQKANKSHNRRNFIKEYHFYRFLVKNRRLLRYFYGGMKQKELFKRIDLMKKKNNWNTCLHIFMNLELRLNSQLYQNQLIPKVKLLKQLILHKYIKINKNIVKGYSLQTNYNDIVSTDWHTSTLMVDRRIKIFVKRKLRRLHSFERSFLPIKYFLCFSESKKFYFSTKLQRNKYSSPFLFMYLFFFKSLMKNRRLTLLDITIFKMNCLLFFCTINK